MLQNARGNGADRCGPDERSDEWDLARRRSRYSSSQRIQKPVGEYHVGSRRSSQPAAHPPRLRVDHFGESGCRDERHEVHLVSADSEYSPNRAVARFVEQHERRSGVGGEKTGAAEFLDELTRDRHRFF